MSGFQAKTIVAPVDFAKEINTDLTVMLSCGRTGLSHMLLGSVAECVVRLSHYPVFVLWK